MELKVAKLWGMGILLADNGGTVIENWFHFLLKKFHLACKPEHQVTL